jgi:multiple RNA-binding domain-containing protein 1
MCQDPRLVCGIVRQNAQREKSPKCNTQVNNVNGVPAAAHAHFTPQLEGSTVESWLTERSKTSCKAEFEILPLPLIRHTITMSADETTESTRVFVSGLPISFTSKDLRKHFSEKFSVTDAHVVPDRRIGFVGFPDTDTAQDVVKYFNRSFIRMSRIAVALARPVDITRDASGQAAPVSQKQEKLQNVRKRKREQRDDGEQHRQVQDFASKEEAKEDVSTDLAPTVDAEFAGFLSDDNESTTDDAESATNAVSNDDWLRGKTSRTLDLEIPEDKARKSQPVQQLPSPVSPEPALLPATTEAPKGDDVGRQSIVSSADVPNGRLFVRNLAFSAGEGDLEALFATFGKLEEVRHLMFFLPIHPLS